MTTPAAAPASVPEHGEGPVPVPGRLDDLRPGLRRCTAPNPGLMTGPGTNSYLVGAGADLAVVDPGPDDHAHLERLAAAAAATGARIRWILVTHTHPDHFPGAARLAADTGAAVVGHRAAEGFAPDRTLGHGDVVEGPDFALEAVHTPGHASDHLCWRHRPSGVLLTGDHVMHGSTVVIRPPDGDVGVYLDSLAATRALGVPALAPGHGRLIADPGPVLDALVAHRRQRGDLVAAALAGAGRGTVDQLLPLVYADVTEAQLPVARFSLWAHLRQLVAEGQATAPPGAAGEAQLEGAFAWSG